MILFSSTLFSIAPHSLKTSKVSYLEEAFQFYSAIKSRGYYKTADKYVGNIYSAYQLKLFCTQKQRKDGEEIEILFPIYCRVSSAGQEEQNSRTDTG